MNGDEELLVGKFFDRTLPKARWTHEAHLIVCHFVVAKVGPAAAVPVLRSAIKAYNEAVGTPNTEVSGYHETLTQYYVGAVDYVAADISTVFSAAETQRQAPLRNWSSGSLFSPEARRIWMPPDLLPLPWAQSPAS